MNLEETKEYIANHPDPLMRFTTVTVDERDQIMHAVLKIDVCGCVFTGATQKHNLLPSDIDRMGKRFYDGLAAVYANVMEQHTQSIRYQWYNNCYHVATTYPYVTLFSCPANSRAVIATATANGVEVVVASEVIADHGGNPYAAAHAAVRATLAACLSMLSIEIKYA